MRLTRSLVPSLAVCACLVSATSLAGAQSVRGTLVDAVTEQPLKSAEVSLVHERGTTVARSITDSAGRYIVTAPRPGTFHLSVRHLGYQPAASTRFEIDTGTIVVGIRLELVSERLGTVRIVAEGIPAIDLSDGFAERRARGIGYFRTPAEIARIAPRLATDAFRGFPGLEVFAVDDPTVGGKVYTLNSSRGLRSAGSLCKPSLYVDAMPTLSELNEAVLANELDKIEFYPTSQGVPPGYRAGQCGTLVIWTNRFRER